MRLLPEPARRALLGGLLAGWPLAGAAHEVPNDVTVQALLRPQGRRLELLVRVPLEALRDVEFPRRGPGYLDLPRLEPFLRDAAALWLSDPVELREDERPLAKPRLLAVRVSLPSDRSFADYAAARAHVTGEPLSPETDLYWNQALVDALFEYEVRSDGARFAIRPGWERLGGRVVTALRFLPPGGAVRAFEFESDPGLVRLDPRWHQAALRFVGLGFRHILDGADHLLFLLCLVIPFRRPRGLILVVTSFTLAHSVTLIAAALGMAPSALWFPPLIEALIAASIVYMAVENVLAPRPERRIWISFGFGLVHGFGFSFALRETLQFAGAHLLTSLVAFNVGVELGQLAVLLLLVPALELLFRRGIPERIGTIVLSAFVAHSGWHWALERAERLRQFPWALPALDAARLAVLARWLLLVTAAAALLWLVFSLLLPPAARPRGEAGARADE